jgi:hypothetical protein
MKNFIIDIRPKRKHVLLVFFPFASKLIQKGEATTDTPA